MTRLRPPALVPFEPETYPETFDLGYIADRLCAQAVVDKARRDPDWSRLIAGMRAARARYVGPVGATLAHTLESWGCFGYRFGNRQQIDGVLAELLPKRDM